MRKNAIHNISNIDGISEYYTVLGQEDFVDDDGFPRIDSPESSKVYAKCIRNKLNKNFTGHNKFRFYIAVKANNKPYNPVNVKEIPEAYGFVNKVCKGGINFTEVNQNIFQKYIEFLKSKNTRWLLDIEREVI
jgi:hypothetical protein